MNDPTKLRKKFLSEYADDLLELYGAASTGKGTFFKCIDSAREEMWDLLKHIIKTADDPTPLAKLTDGDITQRVDAVLSEVASGELTPDEGKRLIGLLQAGFDITELPKLIEKLNEMEKA